MSFEPKYREAIQKLVAEALSEATTPEHVYQIVDMVTASSERATERALTLAPPPEPIACQAGCAWCCTMRVSVTPPELLRIAAHLRATLTDEALADLRERLAERDSDTHGLDWREHVLRGVFCPLLVNNACSIHPVRPLACRSHNSLDAGRCRQDYERRFTITIPLYAPQQDIANGICRGLSLGVESAGREGGFVELVGGLRVALDTPDAAERWLAGEPIFAGGQAPEEDVQTYKRIMADGEDGPGRQPVSSAGAPQGQVSEGESAATSFATRYRDSVSRLAQEALAEERSVDRVFQILALAGESAQRSTERALELMPPPEPIACAKGCTWCCYLKVAVTAAEALRLASFLREQLAPDTLGSLMQQLAETGSQTRGLDWQEHVKLRLPCPLLKDNACSVHAVRPLSCRGHNSLDARPCEDYVRRGGLIKIPLYPPQADIAGGIRDGLSDGMEAAGVQGEQFELVSALRTALETPDAAERWLAGEPIFAVE